MENNGNHLELPDRGKFRGGGGKKRTNKQTVHAWRPWTEGVGKAAQWKVQRQQHIDVANGLLVQQYNAMTHGLLGKQYHAVTDGLLGPCSG